MKYSPRNSPGHLAAADSSRRARIVDAAIMTVTWTIPKRSTRPIDWRKFMFPSAVA